MEKPNKSDADLEEGCRLRLPAAASGGSSEPISTCSDANDRSRSSSVSGTEIFGVSGKRRESSVSECSVELVDLESGAQETKVHVAKHERDCRICHLSLDAGNQESGAPIQLGCSCKGDLAAAHTHCAGTWFKIKGNKTCEICGSTARNVAGVNAAKPIDQWNESGDDAAASADAPAGPPESARRLWWGHRVLNFLLACMVFAFVISWLFHFNVPS